MKILRIQASGLKLFKEEISIDFYAKQRVSADKNEMLTNVFSKVYINNVMSMVGINASGKTSTLKVISFVLQMLKNEPINNIGCNDILEGIEFGDEVTLTIYFVAGNEKLMKLYTVIKAKAFTKEVEQGLSPKYYISDEKLWGKSFSSIRSKRDLFDFSNSTPIEERSANELFLLEDVSVIVAHNKKQNFTLTVMDTVRWTNSYRFIVWVDFPTDLVQFLDPSIEYLKFSETGEGDQKFMIKLKFYGKTEITLYNPLETSNYLSSGTVKGVNIFMMALQALQVGGYLIIDEIENHFNKEIVSTLIRLFMDSRINKSGAVLIFSTHYVELLDIFERNDSIYVIKNKDGIGIENLSDLLKRNDMKKSDIFQSGYLENTTPSYESYINLKRSIVESIEKSEV
jgi:ABC-type Na+ transport system ATPase subunit NatA